MRKRGLRNLFVACALSVASWAAVEPADAGNWSARTLNYESQPAQSLPLWYEYRATVVETGPAHGLNEEPGTPGSVTAATINTAQGPRGVLWNRAGTAYPLTTPAGKNSFVMGTGMWVAGGWTQSGHAANRQAALWTVESRGHVDQHGALARSGFSDWDISAIYSVNGLFDALAPVSGKGYWAVGYIRQKLSAASLSKPALWRVDDHAWGTSTVRELPTGGADYGIAYGLSEKDKNERLHACGGVGSANGLLQATCWNVTAVDAPTLITTPAGLQTGDNVATTVVQRVRTVNLGGGSGTGSGLQNIAVGYLMQTDQSVMGFTWNLTTDELNFSTALASTNDSLLSDIAVQRYTQGAQTNVNGGKVYHGAMVVGSGTDTARPSGIALNPNLHPAALRGIAQTRIADSAVNAAAAPTCNMELQIPAPDLPATVEMVSGVSTNGLYMVGTDAAGRLVRMENNISTYQIRINARRAHVYSAPSTSTEEIYYWAEVVGEETLSDIRVIWSNTAGCQQWATGASCRADLNGVNQAQSTRNWGSITPSATYAYVQAALPAASPNCVMTPVYAVADLAVAQNPSTTTIGADEDWRACGNVPTGRHETNYNVDVKRDFHHCGACGASADDGLACTADSCVDGRIRQRVNNNQHQRRFSSNASDWHRGSWLWDPVPDEANSGPSNRNSLGTTFIDWVGESGHSQEAVNNLNANGIIYLGVVDNSYADSTGECSGIWPRCASTFNYGPGSSNWRFKIPVKESDFTAGVGRYADHEEWFAFYYRDGSTESNDNLRFSTFYGRPGNDVWRNDIDVSMFFRCDHDGSWNNFRRCPGTTDSSGRIFPWETNSFSGVNTNSTSRQTAGQYGYCLANVSQDNDGQADLRLEINQNDSNRCGGSGSKGNRSGWAVIRIQRWIDGGDSGRVNTIRNNDMCSEGTMMDFYWGHRR